MDDLEITGEGGYGYPPLIERLASRYRVTEESVVTAAGTSFANHLALAALDTIPATKSCSRVPPMNRCWPRLYYLGAKVKHFQRRFEDGFAHSAAEIEKHLSPQTRLIVMTNFHNPTGVLY